MNPHRDTGTTDRRVPSDAGVEALTQNGIRPDLIVGSSVGALNGVMLVKNPTLGGVRLLKNLWLSLRAHGPFRGRGVRVLTRLLQAREFLFANNNALRI